MPLYEYFCQQCKTNWEELRNYSQADSNLSCPVCSSDDVRRLISKANAFSSGTSLYSSSSNCSSCSGNSCSTCGLH